MIIEEFKYLIKNLLYWILLLVIVSFAFFIPLGSNAPLSVSIFEMMKERFLPGGVELLVTNPLSGFLAQVAVSFALSFLTTFPIFLYGVLHYLFPALSNQERHAIIKVILPSVLLFFSGCVFAYFIIIPQTFKLLYPFAIALGAIPFFLVGEFIHLIFGIMIAVGFIFLLPIFMVLLSSSGVVSQGFWRENWRYAVAFFLIFSAIITPDGTGITMILLSLPLSGLYVAGSLVAGRGKRDLNYKNNK